MMFWAMSHLLVYHLTAGNGNCCIVRKIITQHLNPLDISLRFHGDQQLRRESHSCLLSFDMESSIKVCWSRHNPIREHWVRKKGWPLHLCCQNNYHGVGKLCGGPTQIVLNRLEKNDVVLPQQNSRITHIRIILKMCFIQ